MMNVFVSSQPIRNKLLVKVGIVSSGVSKCGDRLFPGIYARVGDRQILEFIRSEARMDPATDIPVDAGEHNRNLFAQVPPPQKKNELARNHFS